MKLGVDPLWLQGYDVPRQRERAPEKAGQVPVYRLLSGIEPLDTQPPEGYAPADLPSAEGHFYLRVIESGMEDAGDPAWRSGAHPPGRAAPAAADRPGGLRPAGPAVLRWYYQQGSGVTSSQRSGLPPELVAGGAVLQRQRPC